MPELTQRLVGLMSDRIRETTRMEQQRDRLAAWENFPRAWPMNSTIPLRPPSARPASCATILKRIKDAVHELGKHDLTAAQKSEIEKLEASFVQPDETPLDTLAISDLEDQIDSLLRSHGQNDLWQLAADLAHRNVKPEALESLFATLDADMARAALVRIAASVEIANLLNEIESSTSRISDLVRRDQGIHLHGPDAGAECGCRERPGEHSHHPAITNSSTELRCSATIRKSRCW